MKIQQKFKQKSPSSKGTCNHTEVVSTLKQWCCYPLSPTPYTLPWIFEPELWRIQITFLWPVKTVHVPQNLSSYDSLLASQNYSLKVRPSKFLQEVITKYIIPITGRVLLNATVESCYWKILVSSFPPSGSSSFSSSSSLSSSSSSPTRQQQGCEHSPELLQGIYLLTIIEAAHTLLSHDPSNADAT